MDTHLCSCNLLSSLDLGQLEAIKVFPLLLRFGAAPDGALFPKSTYLTFSERINKILFQKQAQKKVSIGHP
jgi:hypothetical protein